MDFPLTGEYKYVCLFYFSAIKQNAIWVLVYSEVKNCMNVTVSRFKKSFY